MGYWSSLPIQPESGLTFPWAELIQQGRDMSTLSMGPDGVTADMKMLVYYKDLSDAVQQILGYSQRITFQAVAIASTSAATPVVVNAPGHGLETGSVTTISGTTQASLNGVWTVTEIDANNFSLNFSVNPGGIGSGGFLQSSTLQRNLPFRHPRWDQLWCSRVASFKGIQPQGNELQTIAAAQQITGTATAGVTASWTLAELGLQFVRPPYAVLSDNQAGSSGGEWNRFTDRHWKPSVQMLSREGGTFKFAEGNALSGSPPGPLGLAFPGSIGHKLPKLKLTRTWYQLPELCIYDQYGFPANLIQYLATVNNAVMWGRPAQTLLLEGFEVTPKPLQLPLELMGLLSNNLIQLQYDVTFQFEYFRPPPGTNTTTVGHNCFPWAGDALWYLAKAANTLGTAYQLADFNGLFSVI
jgi:hypothetical protein